MINIIIDESAGFCFGVKNAVNKTKDTVRMRKDKKIYTYGPLIHNRQALKRLEDEGVNIVKSIDEIQDDIILIIRSHGIPLKEYEKIKEKNIEYIDSTCPYVYRIHKIVHDAYKNGYKVIIVGDKDHPEVMGINGWCNNEAIIVDDEKTVDKLPLYDKICLVAQTTISSSLWDRIVLNVKNRFKDVEIYNTRCSATEKRQSSAKELSKKVDVMVVVGGYNSSNTRKLFEICKTNCNNTYHIETANDLPYDIIKQHRHIGVTAGASTPDWILKEVINRMQEINSENIMEEYEKSLKTLHIGDTIKGTVLTLNDEEVMVNIGYKADGIIKKEELVLDMSLHPSDVVNVGDEIEVKILSINDGEGNVVLSKKMVEADKNWYKIENAFEENTILEGKVVEIVKGGGIVEIFGIKTFMPASLFDLRYVNDLESFKNENVNVKVIEFNKDNKKVIVSRKVVLQEEREKKQEEFWNTVEEGQKIVGEVKRLTDFGVFVDIGGLDGLIHISELSWGRVEHPSEIVKPNEKVEVVVLSMDQERNRVSLGLKQTQPEPWTTIEGKYNIGDILDVKVLRFANFGAFVEIEPGVDGLVHISQISDKRIGKPSDVLDVYEIVKAKIIDMNIPERKISLSIKEAISIDGLEDGEDIEDTVEEATEDIEEAEEISEAVEGKIEELTEAEEDLEGEAEESTEVEKDLEEEAEESTEVVEDADEEKETQGVSEE